MRKLITKDIPAGCRALKALGLKEKANELAKKSTTAADLWQNGFDFLWDIFDTATEAQGEQILYTFLAGPFEMTAEEVANLEVSALLQNLETLAKENDLTRFFTSVARVMAPGSST